MLSRKHRGPHALRCYPWPLLWPILLIANLALAVADAWSLLWPILLISTWPLRWPMRALAVAQDRPLQWPILPRWPLRWPILLIANLALAWPMRGPWWPILSRWLLLWPILPIVHWPLRWLMRGPCGGPSCRFGPCRGPSYRLYTGGTVLCRSVRRCCCLVVPFDRLPWALLGLTLPTLQRSLALY